MHSDETFLLVSGDFVRTGGMDVSNYYLADYLARRKYSVHLVAHRVDPVLLAHPNILWHKATRPLNSHLIGEYFLSHLAKQVTKTKGFEHSLSVVNGGNCPLPGYNWVHYVHAASEPKDQAGTLRKLKTKFSHFMFLRDEANAFRSARVIVANSKKTKTDLVERCGVPENKIHVLYYGSNPELFYPVDTATKKSLREKLNLSSDKFLFLFIGALGDRRKGFDTLFNAWKDDCQDMLDTAELVVVGHGSELAMWKSKARCLPYSGAIKFLGFRNDVPDILRACDAFVAPARYEAFGLAALEAICCGLPAIVSRGSGVAERFSGDLQALLLTDAEKGDELAAKMHLLHTNSTAFYEPVARLSENMRSYTWDDMGHSFCRLFESTASEVPTLSQIV